MINYKLDCISNFGMHYSKLANAYIRVGIHVYTCQRLRIYVMAFTSICVFGIDE